MITETNQELLDYTKTHGYPDAVKVVYVATVPHVGWELDNQGWIVEMSDKSLKAFTTSHGWLQEWSLEELKEKNEELEASLKQLKEVQELIKQVAV